MLKHFLISDFSVDSLERWANLIEGREDVEYEESKQELLKELIFRLANPVLEGQITESVCTELIFRLNQV
ncbi:MAG: hypothetical protein KME42_02795 [Tildeniella nuda ZEHNDER 1965/U140]|nr:hypothetical protein [Tildeniella nuda ZEHNDER 1965/U140]